MALFIAFVIVWFAFLLVASDSKDVSWPFAIFALFSIVLYYGFAFCNAVDIPGYMDYFNMTHTHGWVMKSYVGTPAERMEPGLFLLMQFTKILDDNYYLFQFVILFLEVVIYYYGLYKLYGNKKDSLLFILITAVQITFLLAAMKQGIAIVLFVLAVPFIIKHEWRVYLPIFLIAFFFHRSVLILVLVPVLWRLLEDVRLPDNISKWIPYLVFAICNLGYLLNVSLNDYLSTDFLAMLFDSSINSTQAYDMDSLNESDFGILKVLEMDVCYILVFFLKSPQSKQYRITVGLFVTYYVLNMLMGGILVHRMNYYLETFYYIMLFSSLYRWMREGFNIPSSLSYAVLFIYLFVFYMTHTAAAVGFRYEYHLLDFLK